MRVSISTAGGQFHAIVKMPRTLVLSAWLAIAGAATEAVRCEIHIHEMRALLAQCQQKQPPARAVMCGQ